METTPAHLSDVDQTQPIHLSLEAKGLSLKEHIVDAGYVDSELLVKSKIDFDIELIGPVRPSGEESKRKRQVGMTLASLKLTGKQKQLHALKDKKVRLGLRQLIIGAIAGVNVKFPSKACRNCDFRHLCVKSKSESEPRKLRLRPQEEHQILQTIRKQQDTDEWKKRYNTRAGIEGTLSQAINAFGLRQARYRNLPKVRLQHQITAVAINVVRMVSWLNGIPHATTRTSRFAALAVT